MSNNESARKETLREVLAEALNYCNDNSATWAPDEDDIAPFETRILAALAQQAPDTSGEARVDYEAAIAYAFKHFKWAQGTTGCIAFSRGAEWAAAQAAPVAARIAELERGLRYYADGDHFIISDDTAWDTVSGEPQNFHCDEAGTATVEDGSIAGMVLRGEHINWDEEDESPAAATTQEAEKP